MKSHEVMGKICPNCNTLNPLEKKTCINCGQPLPDKQRPLTKHANKKQHSTKPLLYWLAGILVVIIIGAIVYGIANHSIMSAGTGTYAVVYENRDHQPIKKVYLVAWGNGTHNGQREDKFLTFKTRAEAEKLSLPELKKYARQHPHQIGTYRHSQANPTQLSGHLKFSDHHETLISTSNNKGTAIVSNNSQIKYYRYYSYAR